MTPHEMPAVLDYLQASYRTPLSDLEVGIWAEELAAWRQDTALDAIRALRRTEDRLPSLAAFRAAARAALPAEERDAARATPEPAYAEDADGYARPVADIPQRPALPPAPAEIRRAEIARGRALLAHAERLAAERAASLRHRLEGEQVLERLAETDAARPAAPFCPREDHSECGGPPIVSTKSSAGRRPAR